MARRDEKDTLDSVMLVRAFKKMLLRVRNADKGDDDYVKMDYNHGHWVLIGIVVLIVVIGLLKLIIGF